MGNSRASHRASNIGGSNGASLGATACRRPRGPRETTLGSTRPASTVAACSGTPPCHDNSYLRDIAKEVHNRDMDLCSQLWNNDSCSTSCSAWVTGMTADDVREGGR